MNRWRAYSSVVIVAVLSYLVFRYHLENSVEQSQNVRATIGHRGRVGLPDFNIDMILKRIGSTQGELPNYLKGLTNIAYPPVTIGQLRAINDGEFIQLAAIYLRITNFAERATIKNAIMATRHPFALDLFVYTLEVESKGKDYSRIAKHDIQEENFLLSLPGAISAVAIQDDRAYEYLKSGCNPWFWADRVNWDCYAKADKAAILTVECMFAVAATGRPEAGKLLLELRNGAMENPLDDSLSARNFEGSLLDAAFMYSKARNRSFDSDTVLAHPIGSRMVGESFESRMVQFNEWITGDEGREWAQWAAQVQDRRRILMR